MISETAIYQDFSQELKNLRIENPANPIFAYLNINSIRNKFNDLQEVIKSNIDVVMIAETKTDAPFTTAQFLLDNYHQSFRLDINSKSGGILVYLKSSFSSRKLKCYVLLKSIQAIPFELNLRKEKWLVTSIHRPPSQDSEFFLNSLTIILNQFTKTYDNYLIMGDSNLEPHDKRLG